MQRLAAFLQIRSGEARLVGFVAALFALIEAGTRTGRQCGRCLVLHALRRRVFAVHVHAVRRGQLHRLAHLCRQPRQVRSAPLLRRGLDRARRRDLDRTRRHRAGGRRALSGVVDFDQHHQFDRRLALVEHRGRGVRCAAGQAPLLDLRQRRHSGQRDRQLRHRAARADPRHAKSTHSLRDGVVRVCVVRPIDHPAASSSRS